ncbi:hypothetical protein BH11BAC6_BH11BAC6_06440 [soil metagenome]
MQRIFLIVPPNQFSISIIACIAFVVAFHNSFAQYSSPLSVFPYHEDFELDRDNWFPGGVSPDWAWGTPAKQVIDAAGNGSKCWITGGLSGSSYNAAEYSWLQSPCFDFSALDYPYITFKIFWETEWKYDGASMEYSLDGGNIWQPVDIATQDCLNSNWYNLSDVIYLSGRKGWAGNVQPSNGNCLAGNGSGKWVDAQVTLPSLAHAPKVIFRFLFGAGTSCNSYDGFAFDDITISEAPPNNTALSFICGAGNTVNFFNNSSLCPQVISWNFGDPASSTANTSTLPNPVHTFSNAGTYNVKLSVSSNENAPSTITKQITVITLGDGGTTNASCDGFSDGVATVLASGAAAYNYSWNTNPVQTTATAKNLAAGIYTATVSSANSCTASKDFTITAPLSISVSFNTEDAVCASSNGQITANISGGTAPYNYTWSPANNNAATISGLAAGAYTLAVSDANNCAAGGNTTVESINPLNIFLGNDTTICPGSSFMLSPGTFLSYTWQDNSTIPVYTVTREGAYSVRVTDQQGCAAADTIKVENDCGVINFPTAFTPNSDRLNDYFGPLGSLQFMADYRLIVYNRWGQMVFESHDPFYKWNGYVNNNIETGTYVWFARYNYREQKNIFKKGTVTIIK